MKTQGLFSQTYGRFEARIKIPAGQGVWPAFWMLGKDISSIGWPDHPFFIILNVAVGGNWPGPPDNTTVFPQQMLVDYVRVYTKQ